MSNAPRDDNFVTTLMGVDFNDMLTPERVAVDPVNGRLLVSAIITGAGELITVAYDYIAYTNTNTTTDTYVYKSGGAGGTTVATLTIVYSDATTKQIISTVTRT